MHDIDDVYMYTGWDLYGMALANVFVEWGLYDTALA